MNQLKLPHGTLALPTFLPDATRGVVRGLDPHDLEASGVQALVMNTFHLMRHPGSSTIAALGGLHRFSGWSHPIVTDSGGFQIYSLIRQNAKYGCFTEKGVAFHPEEGGKLLLTPEKTVLLQLRYGADVVICLDDCTHPDDPPAVQRQSVDRTVRWARAGKTAFLRNLEQRQVADDARPLLFAVVQGGTDPGLRKECAERLLELGFDGYAYGGWPLDSEGELLVETLDLTRRLIPAAFPMHALGIGHPTAIARCAQLGYGLFDSALPTRDARHGRLYVRRAGEHACLYLTDERWRRAAGPLDDQCDCWTCRHHSIAYLHHLLKIADSLYPRLATLHNLRCVMRLTEGLRAGGDDGVR